jgi:aminoglycoside phosphotransferase (APT) family kinase protein
MRKPWKAEIDLSLGQATRLVNEQCPDLAPANLEFLGAGWDNYAYRVNRRWVFRFPRRQLAVDLLKAETQVLPKIAQYLPLAIPQPGLLGQPDATYPWPFTGYLELPGRTACRALGLIAQDSD